jgi:hypothetical protein
MACRAPALMMADCCYTPEHSTVNSHLPSLGCFRNQPTAADQHVPILSPGYRHSDDSLHSDAWNRCRIPAAHALDP